VDRIVLLTLAETSASPTCAAPRTGVLACRDALAGAGVAVDIVTAGSDADIDAVLHRMPSTGLIVAAAADGQVRAVLRRLVRRYAPPPSKRPADLPADRTVPDLPPVGLLPLGPINAVDLVSRLGLPRDPDAVAKAILGGRTRGLDLLRTDAGSVTLDGALLGGSDEAGRAVRFHARVDVDDVVLSDGREPLLAVSVLNADSYAVVDGLPMATDVDPADGVLDVAVAIPVLRGTLRRRVEVEVRRAHGRAVAVTPRTEVPLLDDGVAGTLARKRTWWMERACWSAYVG
jgi:hypothetical protein